MNTIALELFQQFNQLEAHFGQLLDRCTTEAQKDRLRACYMQGWRSYNVAINREFDLNDARIQQLQTNLVVQSENLTTGLAHIENIVDTINTVASVVAFGAAVALA